LWNWERRLAATLQILVVALFALTDCGSDEDDRGATVITNVIVVDGTGAPPRRASVRIVGDRIVDVGDLETSKRDAVVDAKGWVLAPGFIDTHSHADFELLERLDALAAVSQGITTAIVGQDGGSAYPLSDFFTRLEREPATINVASYAGFGTLRHEVMGEDLRRAATRQETERMRVLLRKEMDAGALGLATGLEYAPMIHSSTDEVIALAREAASHGGRYISHVRSEDRHFWEAVYEAIAIGRAAEIPVQISHIKLALRKNLGRTERLIGILDGARAAGVEITADIYPYTYWESTLSVLIPDGDFENREKAEFALSQVTTPDGAYLGAYKPNPEYAGKTLREVAEMRGVDPVTALIDLILEAEAFRKETGDDDVESVVATSMQEADIEHLMNWPHTNLCTDGELAGSHPRGFGTYPRFLGRYVRKRGIMDLASAVHKATALAAAHVGIGDRGAIQPGMMADLVLFDPSSVLDRATPAQPHALSVGIQRVWVNGEIVYENGRTTDRRPGRVIRREPSAD
jgi:N-acyl-D-amino-acid deacylase